MLNVNLVTISRTFNRFHIILLLWIAIVINFITWPDFEGRCGKFFPEIVLTSHEIFAPPQRSHATPLGQG